tara:strand:- start:5467 stop:5664 length:198 start_codon:yes stop_codon:yes gene_type:complete
MVWGSKDREEYRNYMIDKLGEKEFDSLTILSNERKTWKKWELKELRQELKRRIDELEPVYILSRK